MRSSRGMWHSLTTAPSQSSAQHRLDRALVFALMVGGVALGILGVIRAVAGPSLPEFFQPIGGLGLALVTARMLYVDRPRPLPIIATALVLAIGALASTVAADEPLRELADPATISLIVGTGIVAAAVTDHRRWVWMTWVTGMLIATLLVGIGIGMQPLYVAISMASSLIPLSVGMYMVGKTRSMLDAASDDYTHLVDSTGVGVTTIDATGALAALDEHGVRLDALDELVENDVARAALARGLTITEVTDGSLAVSGTTSRSEAESLLRRMVVSRRNDPLARRVTRTMLAGKPSEYVSRSINGTYVLTKWAKHPSAPHMVTAITIDISDQKRAEQALELEIRSKDQFIASVSHELRTPLTAVLGLAEELHRDAPDIDSDERTELLGIIAEQTRDISGIVEDLLVAARAEMNEISVRASRIDLVTLVEQSVEVVGVDASLELPSSLPALGDGIRVRQILRNLLTNASRYGGGQIRVTGSGANGSVWIEVRDDGPPIEQFTREKIFSPYQRGHVSGSTPDSVGLGLTVSRTLADLMHGSLTYGHDGSESVFRLTLPRPS